MVCHVICCETSARSLSATPLRFEDLRTCGWLECPTMRALQLHTSPAVPLQRHHNKADPNQILTTTPHAATNCALTVRATTRADAQARTRRHTARCVYPHAPHRTPHTSQHILHTLRFTTDRTHTPLRTTTTTHVTTMAASFPPCSACPRPRSSSRQQCAQPAMAGQQPLSSLRLGNHPVPRTQRRRAAPNVQAKRPLAAPAGSSLA